MTSVSCQLISSLYKTRYKSLIHYAQSLGVSSVDASDMVQETFRIAWEKRHQLKSNHALFPWIKTILRNLCYKNGTIDSQLCFLGDGLLDQQSCDGKQIYQRVFLQQISDDIKAGMNQKAGQVATLFYFHEYSIKEISCETKICSNTVSSYLFRTRAFVKDHYENCAEALSCS
ncbi:RNA polymerase sigma factor [Pseudobacteriovorax antillogorgiicola]|nr:sigma-70 family RNA polymerase sigma factor [Pseudobacteriovorax antillogorgiicola]